MAELYKVQWTKLEAPDIDQRQRDFLAQMETDDGTFLISEDGLDQAVADWEERSRIFVPVELVKYLREQLAEAGEDFSVAVF